MYENPENENGHAPDGNTALYGSAHRKENPSEPASYGRQYEGATAETYLSANAEREDPFFREQQQQQLQQQQLQLQQLQLQQQRQQQLHQPQAMSPAMNQQYQQQYCSMPLGTDQQQQYRSMPLGTGQQPFYPQEQQYSPQGMTFLPSYSPAASSQTPYTGETLAQNPLRRPFPTQSSVQTEAPYGSPNATKQPQTGTENGDGRSYFDYSYVGTVARIALYDDLRSAPRITEVQPSTTAEYIESLASKIYEQAKMAGGSIPYTVIREVSENFIHAQFAEIIVSILDEGNTIRFADQGPGISQKEKAQLPGFTSAIEPMKRFIRGVGSGLPIVKEYLDLSHGTISIEDNLGTGAVVTVSLRENPTGQSMSGGKGRGTKPSRGEPPQALVPPLSQRERDFLPLFLSEGALGVTDLVNLTGAPNSSAHSALAKLEESGLIEKTVGKKRILTDLGYQIATSL